MLLFDELTINEISKQEACELFGKSPKTLKRWNENPPPWVIRIIRLLGKKPTFPDAWHGWYFEREWICDPGGNCYHINDVSNLWIERQISQSVRGTQSDIYSLKNQLEQKVKQLESTIRITLENSGEEIKSWKVSL